ncbi:MAG: RluA family pseudouridine synthase [Actinomycetota bacterium]|nr:RluA family pseudouridine synthase [Actinomycetota bacterium]
MMLLTPVAGALDGERADRAVALLTGLTRAEVAALVDAGGVRLDGRVVTARGRKVRAGQVLQVDSPEPVKAEALAPDPSVPFGIVYEDGDVAVVDKPAGVVVHPGAGNASGTLVHGLLARYPELAGLDGDADRPGIVHRLDKGTSGLLVVARTPEARRALVAALAGHEVERRYAALAARTVEADEGMIDAAVGRGARDPTRFAVQRDGRPARTRYRVEARYTSPEAVTLLECHLETGRTHQIRVHLAAIGHPVVGDPRYGARRVPAVARLLPDDRPWLHARGLSFLHPRTGQRLRFESPLPEELAAVLDALGR